MKTSTEEEIVAKELSRIRVQLNRKDRRILQITCTRVMNLANSMALSYASEQDVRNVLLRFGIRERVIDNGLRALREINLGEIKPDVLVDLGEWPIPNDVLLADGYTAV